MLLKIRNRFRRDDVESAGLATLPVASDQIIDLRDDEPVVPVPVLTEALAIDVASNGHALPALASERFDAEAHIAAAAGLTAELIADFAARTTDLHVQVESARRRSWSALNHATALSEALVAAAEVRAAEVREAADRQQIDANERLAMAMEVLDRARDHADELIDLAQRLAHQLLATAHMERTAAERALSDVQAEREELVAAARETVQLATSELERRLAELDGEVQTHAAALLQAATAERVRPAPVDEIDRRLARAVSRALSEA